MEFLLLLVDYMADNTSEFYMYAKRQCAPTNNIVKIEGPNQIRPSNYTTFPNVNFVLFYPKTQW